MLNKIKKTSEYINSIFNKKIEYAIILGSGFNKIENKLNILNKIKYKDIPNFPKTSVIGHSGSLILSNINKKNILFMSGRFHYYEGINMQNIIFPIRVFKNLGINKLIITNASGGVNKNYKIGDIMLIKDHINMIPEHPLRGENIKELGPRFVDMHEPYNKKMLKIAINISLKNNIKHHTGVYVALQGPTFETPSEYNMISIIGGDAVGMSTVPEVIAAKHLNMNVLGISIITDLGGSHIKNNKVSHEEVLKNSNQNIHKVFKIIKGVIKYYV